MQAHPTGAICRGNQGSICSSQIAIASQKKQCSSGSMSSRRVWHCKDRLPQPWHVTAHTRDASTTAICRAIQHEFSSIKRTVKRRNVTVCAAQRENSAMGAFDPDRLITLLNHMADAEQVPEPGWCDLMLAATAASQSITLEQKCQLLVAIARLGMEPGDTWISNLIQADGWDTLELFQILEVWGALYTLNRLPEPAWLWSTMQQVAVAADKLGTEEALSAVCLAAELGAAGLPTTDSVMVAEEQLSAWLDILALRMVECGLAGIEPEALEQVARAYTTTFRHLPPNEWVQAMTQEVMTRVHMPPEPAAQLGISLAACRSLPDAFLPGQIYLLTAADMSDIPAGLLAELVWASASWHVGKEGTALDRSDLRPPPRWWQEWFKVTGPILQRGQWSREHILRVIWSLSVMRVRPPEAWLVLLADTAHKLLLGSSYTPLELLYLTRSADMWYGMLMGVDHAGSTPATQLPRVTGQLDPEYEAPMQLAILVRDASQLLDSSSSLLPAGWRRINTRYPPYSLPARQQGSNVTEASEQEVRPAGQSMLGSGLQEQSWQQSVAAQGIHGPKLPPGWR